MIGFESTGMSYINVCKKRVQELLSQYVNFWSHSFGGFLWLLHSNMIWNWKFLGTKLFVLLLGPFWPGSRGHMLMSSILWKNRILMAHQLIDANPILKVQWCTWKEWEILPLMYHIQMILYTNKIVDYWTQMLNCNEMQM